MAKSESKKIWIVRFAVAVVLIAALLISLIWADAINEKLGLVKVKEEAYGGNSLDTALSGGTATEAEVGDDLNVHFLDVGQADTCIIELPDDKNILIDAGNNDDKYIAYIKEYINEKIKNDDGSSITYFDYVILTHPDADHCGGMAKVLESYPAKKFFRPAVYAYNAKNPFEDPAKEILDGLTVNGEAMTYEEVIAVEPSKLNGSGKYRTKCTATYEKAIEAGYNYDQVNGVTSEVEVFGPDSKIVPELEASDPDYYSLDFYSPTDNTYSDWNNYSPIMILEYHGKRFMLSGDAEGDNEAGFVAKATAPMAEREEKYKIFDANYTVDVIKLGHHGSRTSSSQAFLDVLTVEGNCQNVLAVVSCGLDNEYGHPHHETLDRIKAMGFTNENIVGTYENGTIAMQVRGSIENGNVSYDIYMGAQMVRRVAPAVGNDTIALTWKEIVIALIVVIVLVLLVLPLFMKMKKSSRRRAASAATEVAAAFGGESQSRTNKRSTSRKRNTARRR